MVSLQRLFGRGFLGFYRLARRSSGKGFSLAVGGTFASFGRASVIQPPVRLEGESAISIGAGVFIGPGSWLRASPAAAEDEGRTLLDIGDGTSVVGTCVLSAVRSVRLGRKVLLARNVYIADHTHAFQQRGVAILDQGIDRVAPVEIGDGAWLGENVFVAPGVRVGVGAVVGANSVVLADVPDHAVVAGAPARVIRPGNRR